jgi:hypothetical protein
MVVVMVVVVMMVVVVEVVVMMVVVVEVVMVITVVMVVIMMVVVVVVCLYIFVGIFVCVVGVMCFFLPSQPFASSPSACHTPTPLKSYVFVVVIPSVTPQKK